MYFSAPVQSHVTSSKRDFWISHPKKRTHTKFRDEKMTTTIVI